MSERGFSRLLLAMVLQGGVTLGASAAQTMVPGTLQNLGDAVRQSVTTNPETLSAYHEFEAARAEARIARGGYLPRLDAEAGIGRERIEFPGLSANDFSRDRVSLSLSQMLFDGFETRNEVARLDHATRTRYNEVLEASEQIAAETARAYYDVLRHRELASMSEDNYATHRMIYDQIERRVKAGVSRRVDLEQATGRLALSESNLLTDMTNLHDVNMRYQRIVGEVPAAQLDEPKISPNLLPGSLNESLQIALAESPLMNAAIANVWSSEAGVRVAKAPFVPRFDLRARQDVWHDKDDISGRYEEGIVELVMTYNLFNGGSDRAGKRRAIQRRNVALDLREKVCRDIRQEVSIAYNNTQRLEEQKTYLDRHQLSIEKAREAYRRQFDIGQRTLLDMLDTENEYYEARRAYLNAERDHAISYARTLAGMGRLLAGLQLGADMHEMQEPKATREERPDMYAICPQQFMEAPSLDKEKIFRDALEKNGLVRPAPAAPAEDVLPFMK